MVQASCLSSCRPLTLLELAHTALDNAVKPLHRLRPSVVAEHSLPAGQCEPVALGRRIEQLDDGLGLLAR